MTHLNRADPGRPAAAGRDANPRRLVAGNVVFFPMATVYAIFVLPASVLAMLGLTGAVPALASTTGHAHEMLFGFALAVIVAVEQRVRPAACVFRSSADRTPAGVNGWRRSLRRPDLALDAGGSRLPGRGLGRACRLNFCAPW